MTLPNDLLLKANLKQLRLPTVLAEYEKLAVLLGRQPARIASYKRYLAEHGRTSPLFDIPQLVRDIESQFERLALQHRATD